MVMIEDEETALPTNSGTKWDSSNRQQQQQQPKQQSVPGGMLGPKQKALLLAVLLLGGVLAAILIPTVGNSNKDKDASSASSQVTDGGDVSNTLSSPTMSPTPGTQPVPASTSATTAATTTAATTTTTTTTTEPELEIVTIPTTVASPTTLTSTTTIPSETTIQPFTAFGGEATLPNFDVNVLAGYASEQDFAQALGRGVRAFMDRVIARNLGVSGYQQVGIGEPSRTDTTQDVPFDGDVPFDSDVPMPSTNLRNPEISENLNDFGNNNQEEGIEEGDVVAATADFLYAAYGDHIIAWNTTSGEQVVTYQLPPKDDQVVQTEERGFHNGRRDSLWYGSPLPRIEAMILRGTKLIVVASGYGDNFFYSTKHIITSYLATRVLVLETESVGKAGGGLELVKRKDLSGSFVSIRSIGDQIHLVTTTNLAYYNALIDPVDKTRSKSFFHMSDADYISNVTELVNDRLLPFFVERFMDDVRVDGKLPTFFKINNFDDGEGAAVAPQVYPEGYMRSTVLLYSFNIEVVTNTLGEEFTGVNASGAILPDYGDVTVYSAADTMIIASSGMGYSPEREGVVQKTYLLSFTLTEDAALPYTIGSVYGHIINQFSMDLYQGVFRIATTIQSVWFWGFRLMTDPADDEPQEPIVWEEPESSTENNVITLSLMGQDIDTNSTKPSVMQQLDSVKIGKPNEVITAVRFYDRYAYAVTFLQRDPFYKLDLSDASNIQILAEINVTGFSRYLHAIDPDKEIILAIGQETDDAGWILGLQISLFDTRNNANTTVIRNNIEVDPLTYSSSEALWDEKAIRYNMEYGLLIIPVSIYGSREHEFDGFKLFVVNETSIVEDEFCSIEFAVNPIVAFDSYCGYLAPRALIFDGGIVGVKGHRIARKDLSTCRMEWNYDVFVNKTATSCFVY